MSHISFTYGTGDRYDTEHIPKKQYYIWYWSVRDSGYCIEKIIECVTSVLIGVYHIVWYWNIAKIHSASEMKIIEG
jgi:hypothetical protein